MPVGIGSSGYNPQVTGAGSNGRTGATSSASSASSAGSTQRGSAVGSFGSAGSAGSLSPAEQLSAMQEADKAHCKELDEAVNNSEEYKAYEDAVRELEDLLHEAGKDGKIGELEQEMIDKARQKMNDAYNLYLNSPAHKAWEEAAAAYRHKYGSNYNDK